MEKRIRSSALLLLLVAWGLRLSQLTQQNIWWDEARNLDVALRAFWRIPNAPELDIHPPMYFWLLHIWSRLLGVGREAPWSELAFTGRFLSVVAGIVAVVLVYRLARWAAGEQAGLFAVLVAALSPFWLAESQETRMYTLGFALLGGAALAKARPDRRGQIVFVVLSALALLTHYNAVFILAAWYAWWALMALLAADRRRRLKELFLRGLATAILVAPVAPIALRQIPGYANPNLNPPTLLAYLWANWVGHLAGYAWASDWLAFLHAGSWWPWSVLALAVLGLALGYETATARWAQGEGEQAEFDLLRPARSASSAFTPQGRRVGFLLAWLLGGLALYYVAVVDRGAFNIRYAGFVTPALYALLGVGLAGLSRFGHWLPWLAAGVLVVGLVPADRADLADPRFFREDTSGLATWLAENAGPEDVIFVDQKYPFGLYYKRYAIEPDEEPAGPEVAPARYLFVDINTVDRILTRWAGEALRVYWVVWFESDTDPRGAVDFLLEKYGTLVGQTNFRGYWVRWWDLQPPTQFRLAERMDAQVHRWRGGLQTVEIDPGCGGGNEGELPVVVRWARPDGAIERPLKARVALYDQNESRLAQDDRRILNDRHLAPGEWQPGDRPLNVYLVRPPADLAPGAYTLRLLVYDAETLEPVELVDEAGAPAGFEPVIARFDWPARQPCQ